MDYKKAYTELLTADGVSRRERISTEVMRHYGHFDAGIASIVEGWIAGKTFTPIKPSGKKRGRKAKAKKAVAKTPKAGKRRYTKKSKYWKKLGK